MRSKKKKLLFICFSALIMIGLCIGVFADYNGDRVGTIVSSTPYDLGDKVFDVSDTSQTLTSGYYILKVQFNDVPSEDVALMSLNESPNYYFYYTSSGNVLLYYSIGENSLYYNIPFDLGNTYYIYCYLEFNVAFNYTSSNYQGQYVSFSFYEISDTYTIDIYDNSQDVWASVVSVVTDATDSVINNDILLMFAAAIPVISFGVGMLIRLFHKS